MSPRQGLGAALAPHCGRCPHNTVRPSAGDRLEVVHDGEALPFTVFDKVRRVEQGAIVDNKRLGEALAYIAELQKERPVERAKSAPRRRGQTNSAFS